MKTRNLKTDMTEFQWWLSIFLNIKKSHDKVESFWLNWMKEILNEKFKIETKTFIKAPADDQHVRFNQLMWHLLLISNGDSHNPSRADNWNTFPFWLTWLTSSSISNYKEVDLFMETGEKKH